MAILAQVAPNSKRIAWRSIVFPILAFVFALGSWFFLEGLTEGLMPWVIIGCPGCESSPDWRRWLGAVHGAIVGVFFAGSLITLLRSPQSKPLVLQFYVLGHLTFLIAMLSWMWQPLAVNLRQPFVVVMFAIVLGSLVFTYPGRVDATPFRPVSRSLFMLTLAAAAALAPITWHNLLLQLASGGATVRWAESVALTGVLILAGFLSATRRPGWHELGILTGAVYLYLGAAALTVPDQAGSWGIAGGIASLAGGLAYIGATLLEARHNISTSRR